MEKEEQESICVCEPFFFYRTLGTGIAMLTHLWGYHPLEPYRVVLVV